MNPFDQFSLPTSAPPPPSSSSEVVPRQATMMQTQQQQQQQSQQQFPSNSMMGGMLSGPAPPQQQPQQQQQQGWMANAYGQQQRSVMCPQLARQGHSASAGERHPSGSPTICERMCDSLKR